MAEEFDYGSTIRGFSAGQKVFERYSLKELLGRGGMGVVWLAHDEDLERDVALKFLPETVASDPQSVRDLKRETRRSLELTHPHIVRIYDFMQSETMAAISMEYVVGDTLASLKVDQKDGHFEVSQIKAWTNQLCAALAYAHTRAEVVHRDLKPANLMIDERGDLKIADFGIAASVSDSVSRVSVAAGSSGTPVYMSPQQMMGEKPAVTDDIYALGATLYELLTGKPPFHSGNVMLQVMHKAPPPMEKRRREFQVVGEEIPETWEETVAACLTKEGLDRPISAVDVASRLRGLGPVSTPPPPVVSASVASPPVVPVAIPPPLPTPPIAAEPVAPGRDEPVTPTPEPEATPIPVAVPVPPPVPAPTLPPEPKPAPPVEPPEPPVPDPALDPASKPEPVPEAPEPGAEPLPPDPVNLPEPDPEPEANSKSEVEAASAPAPSQVGSPLLEPNLESEDNAPESVSETEAAAETEATNGKAVADEAVSNSAETAAVPKSSLRYGEEPKPVKSTGSKTPLLAGVVVVFLLMVGGWWWVSVESPRRAAAEIAESEKTKVDTELAIEREVEIRLKAEREAAAEVARIEAERLAQEELDRLEAERLAQEEAARLATEAAAKAEFERLEPIRTAKLAALRTELATFMREGDLANFSVIAEKFAGQLDSLDENRREQFSTTLDGAEVLAKSTLERLSVAVLKARTDWSDLYRLAARYRQSSGNEALRDELQKRADAMATAMVYTDSESRREFKLADHGFFGEFAGEEADKSGLIVALGEPAMSFHIDGEREQKGVALWEEIPSGDHLISWDQAGRQTASRKITVKPGELVNLGILQPGPAGTSAAKVVQNTAGTKTQSVTKSPVPLTRSAPVYPRTMRSRGVTGQVMVRFVIDTRGRVTNPEIVTSTNAGFNEAAIDCVKKWRFSPGEKDGVPVSVRIRVPIVFKLE